MPYEMSRRLKAFHVVERDVLEPLENIMNYPSSSTSKTKTGWPLSVPHLKGVPMEAKIENVRYSWEKREFVFLVSHESFAEVPEGSDIPHEATVILNLHATWWPQFESGPLG